MSETQTGSVSDDPGRIIHNLEERLEAAKIRNIQALNQLVERDQTINEQTAEIARLRTELQQSEIRHTADAEAAQHAARLERLLDDARDNLRVLETDGTAMDHHYEGAKSAYLAAIKAFVEASR